MLSSKVANMFLECGRVTLRCIMISKMCFVNSERKMVEKRKY